MLDAGRDMPHGLLPVDERNPVIIDNDGWSDNFARRVRDAAREPRRAAAGRHHRQLRKQPNIFTIPNASDQIAVLSVGLPTFAVAVQRSAPDTSVAFDSTQGPPLRADATGNSWIVTQITSPPAASSLWEMLLDPHTFGP